MLKQQQMMMTLLTSSRRRRKRKRKRKRGRRVKLMMGKFTLMVKIHAGREKRFLLYRMLCRCLNNRPREKEKRKRRK
jgi:hypothetical protein